MHCCLCIFHIIYTLIMLQKLTAWQAWLFSKCKCKLFTLHILILFIIVVGNYYIYRSLLLNQINSFYKNYREQALHNWVFRFDRLSAAMLACIITYWSFTINSLENTFTLDCRLELAHLCLYWVLEFWKKVFFRLLRVSNCKWLNLSQDTGEVLPYAGISEMIN